MVLFSIFENLDLMESILILSEKMETLYVSTSHKNHSFSVYVFQDATSTHNSQLIQAGQREVAQISVSLMSQMFNSITSPSFFIVDSY